MYLWLGPQCSVIWQNPYIFLYPQPYAYQHWLKGWHGVSFHKGRLCALFVEDRFVWI